MGDVLPFRPPVPAQFGRCPACGGATGVLNIGKSHWVYCNPDRIKWFVGCSLLARPREEGPREWLANSQRLAGFREVAPAVHPASKTGDGFLKQTD
jgi:hypothetical protein